MQGASPETQGGGQPTAARATSMGGPVQWAIPTMGTGTNVAGVQGPGANAPNFLKRFNAATVAFG